MSPVVPEIANPPFFSVPDWTSTPPVPVVDVMAALSVALGRAGIGVTALVPETESLEELFLGMTGGDSSDRDSARTSEVAV